MDGDQVPVQGARTPAGPGRRVLLGGALAAGAASLAVAASPAGATPAAGRAPGGVGTGSDRAVAVTPRSGYRSVAGPHGCVRMPHDLAVLLRGSLLPGTRVTLDVDTRVYAGADRVRVLADGRELAPLTARRTGRGHRALITVTLPALAGVREWTLEAGCALPRRYPDDLVADPLPVVVTVADRLGSRSFTLTPVSPATAVVAEPFGACLGATWAQVSWGEGWRASHPSAIVLRSTGPGALPAGTRVEVCLDAQLAASAHLRRCDGVGSASALGRASAGGRLTTAVWTLEEALPAGARVDLLLTFTPRRLVGAPPTWNAATVQVITPAGQSEAQRFTGTESLTSLDDVVTEAARAALRQA